MQFENVAYVVSDELPDGTKHMKVRQQPLCRTAYPALEQEGSCWLEIDFLCCARGVGMRFLYRLVLGWFAGLFCWAAFLVWFAGLGTRTHTL
jgi:hypothetical protein